MRWAGTPGQPAMPYRPPPPPPQKKGGGCLRFVLLTMGGAFLLCCCLTTAAIESADDPLEWDKVAVPNVLGETFLGNALDPSDLPPSSARPYHWRQSLRALGLGYGVSSDVHTSIDDDFAAMAKKYRYRHGNGAKFTWAPPLSCSNKEWQCVFSELAAQNAAHIEPLTELFRRRQREENLDTRELAELVIAFVQNITYRLPTEDTAAFGLLPPVVVVADGSGDCDSKALLAVIILRQLGIDAEVLLASGLEHAALGVALPVPGKKFMHQGRKYAFVEITAPGWAIGAMPPEYDVAKAWKVIPVNF